MPARLETRLDGLVLLEPTVHGDERGFLVETFSERDWREAGVECDFVQDNHSRSSAGTLRGLHFQTSPGQAKLVRCLRGRIWDVAVDLRPDSPTFGQWEGHELDDERHRQLFIPRGFAHGFCVLSDLADVHYRLSDYYDPATEALQRVTSNGEPRDIAAVGDQVYVAVDGNASSGLVARYDAATGERRDSLDLLACAVASGEGVVWAAGCPFAQRLSTDARPLRKLREVFLPFRDPATASNGRVGFRELAVGAGSLWVLGDALDPRLWRLDAHTGKVEATVALPFPPRSVVVAAGAVWVTDALHDTVVPIDVRSNRVLAAVAVGRGAAGVTAAAGAVWVANATDGTVSRIDPRTRRVTATIEVGGAPSEIDGGPGGVWVTSHEL